MTRLERPSAAADSAISLPHPRIARRRGVHVQFLEGDRRAGRLANLPGLGADGVEQPQDLRIVQIAQLERALDGAGDDVRRARHRADAADGADVAARRARHDAVDHVDEPRGREHRVLPLVHRRRPGVVREAGHRHVPPADADDALDDADGRALGFEHAALLDVQLEVAGDVAGERRTSSSRSGSPPTNAMPSFTVLPEAVTCASSDASNWPLTARLPKSPPSSLAQTATSMGWRSVMPRSRSVRATSIDGEHADVAVEVAALRHRVHVRAEDERLQRRVAAGPAADQVAGEVGGRLEAGVAHPPVTTARAWRSSSE
jgi:hypothetical protein